MAAAAAAVLALGIVIPAALAVHDTGAFELDGNAVNGSAAGDDWDNVCHQVTKGAVCASATDTNGATAVDWVSEPNVNTSIFTGGGSKDPQDVSNWGWKDGAGGLPDKDNLLHGFAARYTTTQGEVLYFGSDRLDNSGDAQQGFWFFQNEISLKGTSSGTFNGVHQTGDLLVISDFSNGGTTSTITVYEWNPSCTKAGVTVDGKTCGDQNLLTLATSTNANCNTAAASDNFCGLVNAQTITMPWPFKDKSGTPDNGALNGEFYEGGVNLSALGLADRCFSTVAAETRSSTSTTATLKDFTLGTLGQCTSSIVSNQNWTPNDSATVQVGGKSSWSGKVSFELFGATNGTTPKTAQQNCDAAKADLTSTTGLLYKEPTAQDVSNTAATVSTHNTGDPTDSTMYRATATETVVWLVHFESATTGVPSGTTCIEQSDLTIDNDNTK